MAPLPKCIIDNHVHLWEPDKVYIPWLNNVEKLNKRRDVVDYFNQTTNVKSIIYVETDVDSYHSLVEANWISNVGYDQQIEGFVLFAPIPQGEQVKNYIELLLQITNHKLKGVRYLMQDPNRYKEIKSNPISFIKGVQCLEKYGLSFDITINCNEYPEQFEIVHLLVSQCPRVRFILDHMGKPPCDTKPGDARFEYWSTNIKMLAEHDNVYCKISGIVTELKSSYPSKTAIIQQLSPFVQVVKEAFGHERVLFGSDWPICELSNNNLDWSNWLEILCEIIKDWTEEEKESLFVTNAIQFYRLTEK